VAGAKGIADPRRRPKRREDTTVWQTKGMIQVDEESLKTADIEE